MDRTFQTRVDVGYWALMAVTSALMFYTFWIHVVVIAIVLALGVIMLIEMLIHTHYVVTADGWLKIESGRFSRSRKVELSHIALVRQTHCLPLCQPALSSDVLELIYREGKEEKTVCLSPRNAEAFIACLQKHNPAIEVML